MTTKHILENLTYGIELEGGWDNSPDCGSEDCHDGDNESDIDPSDLPVSCHHWHADGSVEVNANHVGEVVSPLPPYALRYSNIRNWVRSHYPDHTNASCGLHIHIGNLSVAQYAATMNHEFYKYFLSSLHAWAYEHCPNNLRLRNRLNGSNQYCENLYRAESQVINNGGGSCRYSILNWAWSKHGTLEIRVLPMFGTVTFSLRAIEACILIAKRGIGRALRNQDHARTYAHQVVAIDGDANTINHEVII